MTEKALSWYKHTGGAAIYELQFALRVMQEENTPGRFAIAEKFIELAWFDLGKWPR